MPRFCTACLGIGSLMGMFVSSPVAAAEPHLSVPDNAHLVLMVQVAQLLDAPLVKKHFGDTISKLIQEREGLRALLQSIPLAVRKDVDSLLLTSPLPLRRDQGLLVVRGRFDRKSIEKILADRARQDPERLAIKQLSGQVVYHFKDVGTDSWALFASFLDNATRALSHCRESWH